MVTWATRSFESEIRFVAGRLIYLHAISITCLCGPALLLSVSMAIRLCPCVPASVSADERWKNKDVSFPVCEFLSVSEGFGRHVQAASLTCFWLLDSSRLLLMMIQRPVVSGQRLLLLMAHSYAQRTTNPQRLQKRRGG